MVIFLPIHLAKYLKDAEGIQITDFDSEVCLVSIDIHNPTTLINLFYRGAEYGADEYHKIAKENLQVRPFLNKFGLN